MSELSPAQQRALEKLQKNGKSVVEGKRADLPDVDIATMLGIGEPVEIGGKTYLIAGFPLSKQKEAWQYIGAIPRILLVAALAQVNELAADAASIAASVNKMSSQLGFDGVGELDSDGLSAAVALSLEQIDEEQSEAMIKLATLAISRRHPDISPDEFSDSLDIQAFLDLLIAILRRNTRLARRF